MIVEVPSRVTRFNGEVETYFCSDYVNKFLSYYPKILLNHLRLFIIIFLSLDGARRIGDEKIFTTFLHTHFSLYGLYFTRYKFNYEYIKN